MSITTWLPQQPQRQDSLDAQLDDLHQVAARLGMYDAADWLWKARAGGGEPQPTTSTDNDPLGVKADQAEQLRREVLTRTAPLVAPVRSAGGGDQPDTPCPHCGGEGVIPKYRAPWLWGGPAARNATKPCPACTDKAQP